jgi:hypothetical protein
MSRHHERYEHHNYRAYEPDLSDITVWDTLEDSQTVCHWCHEVCEGERPSERHADDGALCPDCMLESIREAAQGTPQK